MPVCVCCEVRVVFVCVVSSRVRVVVGVGVSVGVGVGIGGGVGTGSGSRMGSGTRSGRRSRTVRNSQRVCVGNTRHMRPERTECWSNDLL